MFIEGEENMDLSDGGVEDGLVTNGNYNPAACMNGNSHPFDAAGDEAEDMGGLKSDAFGKVLSFFLIFGWGFLEEKFVAVGTCALDVRLEYVMWLSCIKTCVIQL